MAHKGCSKCDAGYIPGKKTVPGYDHPVDFLRKCDCIFLDQQQRQAPQTLIPWNKDGYYGEDWLANGIEYLKSRDIILLLWGSTGRGKTLLAQHLQVMYAKRHSFGDTFLIPGVDLITVEYGEYTFFQDRELIHHCSNTPFLIFDDFYSSPEFAERKFLSQFENFFDNLRPVKIIVTMNDNPESGEDCMMEAAPTIYSRLKNKINNNFWHIKGDDKR